MPDDQLSLAIGKEGQNARLASKLTGWRIDIKSQSEMAEAEAELVYAEDDEDVDRAVRGRHGQRQALPEPVAAGQPLLRHHRPTEKRAEAETARAGDGRVTATRSDAATRRPSASAPA